MVRVISPKNINNSSIIYSPSNKNLFFQLNTIRVMLKKSPGFSKLIMGVNTALYFEALYFLKCMHPS